MSRLENSPNNLIYVLSSNASEVGGAAKATLLLCETLVETGHHVRLFVISPLNSQALQRLQASGIEVVCARVTKGCRWDLPSRSIAYQLLVEARRCPPRLIHCVSLSVEADYLLRLSPVAPVYLWESTEALPHVKFVHHAIAKQLWKAEAVLVPSQTVERNVRTTYDYKGRIALLPFWAQTPPATALTTSHQRSQNFSYVGRLDLDKGFEYLFEAFRQVRLLHPGATLCVCGGGDVEAVQNLAADTPGLSVRGFISNDEYEQVIARSDAVVLASLHEGYPLALLEACARRKPIISTNVGSIPEVFDGKMCALLVPPRDASALATAMTKLLSEDDSRYQERCMSAAQVFESISSPAVVHGRLLEAYTESG